MNGTQIAAYLVLGVWAVAQVRAVLDTGFVVSATLLPVALAAAGYLFTAPAVSALRKGRDEPS